MSMRTSLRQFVVLCACTRLIFVHAGCGTVHQLKGKARYPAWGDGLSLEEQVTTISAAVYEDCDPVAEGYQTRVNATHKVAGNFVAGWEQVYHLKSLSKWTKDTDIFSIFKKGDECALAFTGLNSASETLDQPFDRHAPGVFCGFTDISEFARAELSDLLTSANWSNTIQPYLKNSCPGGVSTIGHSTGGAQATLLAACANNGSKAYGFTVKAVYTIGSPGISKNPLPNNEAADQCFGGYRWYNHDLVDYDILSELGGGLYHAYVPAVRLSRPSVSNTSHLEVHTYGCKTHCTVKYPNNVATVGSTFMNSLKTYLPRVRDHYTLGLGVANSNCPKQSWFREKAPEAAKLYNKTNGAVLMTKGGGALAISVLMTAFV